MIVLELYLWPNIFFFFAKAELMGMKFYLAECRVAYLNATFELLMKLLGFVVARCFM